MKPGLVVRRRAQNESRRLSFAQERLWYLDQLAPGSPVYNTPLLLRLKGNLDISAFRRALESVVERHEVLRTRFLSSGGRPVPLVLKKSDVNLKQADLRHLPDRERDHEARRMINEEAARPFNLTRDSISRSTLLQVDEQEFLFLYVVHHIVFEGSSVAIFFRDLAAFYNGLVSGKPSGLSALQTNYSDFVAWQRACLDEERLQLLNEFWRRYLAGAPPLELPLDFPRPSVHTTRGAKYYFEFPPELYSEARKFFEENSTTSYRALSAVFTLLLYCRTGLADICVGTPCAPRCRGIEDLIGFFVNTVVLRVNLGGDPTFRQVMRRVEVALHGAIAHSDLPFHKVVDAVQPPRDPSRTPLFQVNFRAPQQPYPRLELDGVIASAVEVLDNGTAKFDLALEIGAFANGATYFEYCSDLFKQETIAGMASDLQALLCEVIAQQDTPLSRLRMVAETR